MAGCTAKGFRLPTNAEWELAARYQDGKNWTPGDHVSGDTSGYCFDNYGRNISSTASTVFGNYAWYHDNDHGDQYGNPTVQPVAYKTANALGLYDMSGNVWQYCFDWFPGQPGYRVQCGGSYNDPIDCLQLGFLFAVAYLNQGSQSSGFRLARTCNFIFKKTKGRKALFLYLSLRENYSFHLDGESEPVSCHKEGIEIG